MRRLSVRSVLPAALLCLAVAFSGCYYEYDLTGDSSYDYTGESSDEFSPGRSASYHRQDFDTTEYPYFAMLDEEEKDAYSQICEEVSAGKATVRFKTGIESNQLSRVVNAVQNDHPEFFWLGNSYEYSYGSSDQLIRTIVFEFCDFADTPEKLESAKAEFDAAARTILAGARSNPAEIDRELYVHDYICRTTVYDELAPYNQSAYSVLVNHRSVCSGYSRAIQYLLHELGIKCYFVTGMAEGAATNLTGNDMTGNHSWNIVVIGGNAYNLDCLWDDTTSDSYGSDIYPFFNITDAGMVKHTRVGMATALPVCISTQFKYSNVYGPTVEAETLNFDDGN